MSLLNDEQLDQLKKKLVVSAGKWRVEPDSPTYVYEQGSLAARFETETDARTCVEAVNAQGWRPIETMPTDDTLILAWCPPDESFPQGRMMIWKASMLFDQRRRNGTTAQSHHLQFPATHWIPLPAPPQVRPVKYLDPCDPCEHDIPMFAACSLCGRPGQ